MIIMDMQSGKGVEEPADPYGEEVLSASWLPEPEMRLGGQQAEHAPAPSPLATQDVDAFLSAVYRYQE